MDAWVVQIDLVCIQPHQHPYLLTRKIPDLINLVFDRESAGPLLHPRKAGVVDDDGRLKRSPGMLIVIPADHLAVLRPAGKGDGRAVNADETLPVIVDGR